jgi:hypothetical protein
VQAEKGRFARPLEFKAGEVPDDWNARVDAFWRQVEAAA